MLFILGIIIGLFLSHVYITKKEVKNKYVIYGIGAILGGLVGKFFSTILSTLFFIVFMIILALGTFVLIKKLIK